MKVIVFVFIVSPFCNSSPFAVILSTFGLSVSCLFAPYTNCKLSIYIEPLRCDCGTSTIS